MKKYFYFVFLACACGSPFPQTKSRPTIFHQGEPLLGGDMDPQHPFVKSSVHLLMATDNGTYSMCSGVLTGDHTVITAGHCFASVKKVYVGFSTQISWDPKNLVVAESFEPHPHYALNANIDMGLVRIPKRLNGYRPIEAIWDDFHIFDDPKEVFTKNYYDTSLRCLNSFNTQSNNCFVQFGWGESESKMRTLRFLTLNYLKPKDAFLRMFRLPQGSRTGLGDSGGPMVLFTTPKSPLKRFCIKKSGGGEGPCLFGIHSKRNVSWGTTTVVTNLPTLASQAGWDIWQ